jgi:hypothetical protein
MLTPLFLHRLTAPILKKIRTIINKKDNGSDVANAATWPMNAQIRRNNLSNQSNTSERRNLSLLDPSYKDSGSSINPALDPKDRSALHL